MHRFHRGAVALLVAVTACAGAAGAASSGPAPVAVAAAAETGAAKARAAPSKQARKRPAQPVRQAVPSHAASVYLMRGFLGVFSLGMDRLNASLMAGGVKTRILGHTRWRSVVDEIAAEAAANPKGRAPIVIVGHSFGGNAALQAAYVLGQQGIPVDLVVTVDPTASQPISPAVRRYLNVYMSNDGLGRPLAASGTGVDNSDVRIHPEMNRPGINHFTMDEQPIVQQQILAAILKALGRTERGG